MSRSHSATSSPQHGYGGGSVLLAQSPHTSHKRIANKQSQLDEDYANVRPGGMRSSSSSKQLHGSASSERDRLPSIRPSSAERKQNARRSQESDRLSSISSTVTSPVLAGSSGPYRSMHTSSMPALPSTNPAAGAANAGGSNRGSGPKSFTFSPAHRSTPSGGGSGMMGGAVNFVSKRSSNGTVSNNGSGAPSGGPSGDRSDTGTVWMLISPAVLQSPVNRAVYEVWSLTMTSCQCTGSASSPYVDANSSTGKRGPAGTGQIRQLLERFLA